MPFCTVLNFSSGEVNIIEYPEGDDRDIAEWLSGQGFDIGNIEYMCTDKLKLEIKQEES